MKKFYYYRKLRKNEIINEKNLVIEYNEILNSIRKIIITNNQRKKNCGWHQERNFEFIYE